ncbi:ABC transporter ATP-binding protein [Rhodococcus sp. 06-235-1A]|uniref:ABC transporter ATP-binding protein n=2 Tax=unclassified Rhodococcus (in: high G+C Gram-positive bacteria) TaxID=192944 RepID=UPI00211B64AA|nr:ABC transporter ATP-binding protein [Rhodococcus sp. 06-235-1A]
MMSTTTGSTTEASSASLAVRDVSVTFSGLKALSGVDFEVAPGELLGLIGPNGAGKTTLVNVISGFQRPTTGSVHLGGIDATTMSATQRAHNGLARTFQGVRLFDHLTVEENIEVAALSRAGRKKARAHAAEALAVLGLADRAHTTAGSLPYGDQRRLAIARCLAMEPQLILMDEPAAGLNEHETIELGDAIDSIRRTHNPAIVLIEHDVALVMRLSDRILVLAQGAPLALGTPAQIRDNPEVIAAYLGVDDAES